MIIGKATLTIRHMRALAFRDGRSAPVRLPLSRKRDSDRVETLGTLTARVRLLLDKSNSTGKSSFSAGRFAASSLAPQRRIRIDNSRKGEGQGVGGTSPSEAPVGYLVCSGLTTYDLPETEGLSFGGQQNPYVQVTLGSMTERSLSLPEGGIRSEWTKQIIRLRVDLNNSIEHAWGSGLVAGVWNDNQPRCDDLMGKGLVRPEVVREIARHPGRDTSCRIKLSRTGRGPKGTLSMVLTFEPDQPGEREDKERAALPREKSRPHTQEIDPTTDLIVISDIVVTNLGNTIALGFGAFDKQDPYVVARLGDAERTTPTTIIVGGTATYDDASLSMPFPKEVSDDSEPSLRLELWNSNAAQDDQVGYATVNLASLLFALDSKIAGEGRKASAERAMQAPLEIVLNSMDAAGYDEVDMSPGVLSCSIELKRHRDNNDEAKETSTACERNKGTKTPGNGISLPMIGATEGPGILKVKVLEATLNQAAEAPEIRLTINPGKRFASSRPLLQVGGEPSSQDQEHAPVTRCVWNQELQIPCYAMDFDELGTSLMLHADIVVAGVLAGQRVLGRGRADITDVVNCQSDRQISIDAFSHERVGPPCTVGRVFLSARFVSAWAGIQSEPPPSSQEEPNLAQSRVSCLHCPGILRVFVVQARELSGLKKQQDPYVVVERMAVGPTIAFQSKPFCSGVATVGAGREARYRGLYFLGG